MRKPKLILMCGLARCGKSTWIKKNKKDAIVICPDEIRWKIFNHQFFFPAENFVWGIAMSMTRLLLDQGKDVIIDATNTTFASRGRFISIARGLGLKTQVIWLQTSIKTCLKRNSKSNKDNKLPDGVIESMAERFEDPIYYKEADVSVTSLNGNKYNPALGFSYYNPELTKGK
jgi:predicted kinase